MRNPNFRVKDYEYVKKILKRYIKGNLEDLRK